MIAGKEKDRSSAPTDTSVQPKTSCVFGDFGYLDCSPEHRVNQDILLWNKGYEACYRELAPRIAALENSLRWYVSTSVENMFHGIGFDGAEAARHRSAQQFWNDYHQERDAA